MTQEQHDLVGKDLNMWTNLLDFLREAAKKSVMQSDGNGYGGDVVLDSVNMLSSYEDCILDQI